MEPKTFLKSLSIIHLALVAGLTLLTVFVLLQGKGFNAFTNENNIFLYIVPSVAILGYFGSQFVFRRMTGNIKRAELLTKKLAKYQSAVITKLILIEAPAFVGLYAYYLSGNALPLVIALCLFAYLVVQKPNKNSIIKNVPLTQEELTAIERI